MSSTSVVEQQSAPPREGMFREPLTDLEDHLLAHLAFEKESLGPLLSTWDHWPQE